MRARLRLQEKYHFKCEKTMLGNVFIVDAQLYELLIFVESMFSSKHSKSGPIYYDAVR